MHFSGIAPPMAPCWGERDLQVLSYRDKDQREVDVACTSWPSSLGNSSSLALSSMTAMKHCPWGLAGGLIDVEQHGACRCQSLLANGGNAGNLMR